MMNDNIRLSPARRNGAARYMQRYFDTLTDWQTYAGTTPDKFPAKLQDVTGAFFSPNRIKGAALLFALHLMQQITASIATLPARAFLAGERLDACRGIAVRRSRAESWWPKLPAFLTERVDLVDGYLFSEEGRTWHCHTLRFNAPSMLEGKTMTTLTLLSLPNRTFFFDQALPYNQAVDLALARLEADDLPGCLGRTNELDCLMPAVRTLKLSLIWLNWLLINSDEREEGGPDVGHYNDWTPVPPAPPAAPASPTSFEHPDFGYPPPSSRTSHLSGRDAATTQSAAPSSTPPTMAWSVQPQPQPSLPALLSAPVTVKLASPNGGEALAYTIRTGARLVFTPHGSPSGLALTPLVEAQPDGSYREREDRCLLTHVPSGLAMNAERPLSMFEVGQALAARILPLTDWNRNLNALPAAVLDRARQIIRAFTPVSGMPNGRDGRGGGDNVF